MTIRPVRSARAGCAQVHANTTAANSIPAPRIPASTIRMNATGVARSSGRAPEPSLANLECEATFQWYGLHPRDPHTRGSSPLFF